MWRSRRLIPVIFVASLALPPAQSSRGQAESSDQKIRFAQITDPHLFDVKGDKKLEEETDNKRVFEWAIGEINKRNVLGPAYEFVVLTGDIGLERVDASDLDAKVAEFKGLLDKCEVKRWIIVPGNNDLLDENPEDIGKFHDFIKRLKALKPDDILAPTAKGDLVTRPLGKNSLFVGFDNASFKNDNNPAQQKRFGDEQLQQLRILAREVYNNHDKNIFIFCHIPYVDDPNNLDIMHLSPDRREGKVGKDKWARQKEKFDDNAPFPASAWTVTGDIRWQWEQIIENPQVKRVFAGHFHSADRWVYYDLDWARNPHYRAGDFNKTTICPPIAVKYQSSKGEQARGFRDVTVYDKTGNITSEIVWSAPPLTVPKK